MLHMIDAGKLAGNFTANFTNALRNHPQLLSMIFALQCARLALAIFHLVQ